MSASIFKYLCGSCGSEFHASGIGDFIYGAFVMRTERGEEAFLDAISSPAYHEFLALAEAKPLLLHFDDRARAGIVQTAFSVACDPSENGESFSIGLGPTCPSCSSREMSSWKVATPPQKSHIPSVTHNHWSRLTDDEKCDIAYNAIRRVVEQYHGSD